MTRHFIQSATIATFAILIAFTGNPVIADEPDCEVQCTPAPEFEAHIELRPNHVENVQINGIVNIGLYAVPSEPGAVIRVSGVQAIIKWNPLKLRLMGLTNNGPYTWLASVFPNDSNIDNLNAGLLGGVPGNDGDAFYNALGQFPPPLGSGPATIPPNGLLVTTLRFRALGGTPSTPIYFLPFFGIGSCTAVYWGDGSPGCDIDGLLTGATVHVKPLTETPGDGDFDGDVDIHDYPYYLNCAATPGPVTPACSPFNFDDDMDVDLADFGDFQIVFGS